MLERIDREGDVSLYYGSYMPVIPYSYNGFARPDLSSLTPYMMLQESLKTIRDTAAATANVDAFNKKLLELAPSEEDRAVLTSIINDEKTHYQYLREIYKAFTGQDVPLSAPITVLAIPTSYVNGLKDALFRKFDNAQKHGFILAAMPTGYYQNIIAKMAVDNTVHGEKYNYLIQKANK